MSAESDRRTFCGGAAATVAASQLGVLSVAEAASVGPLRTVKAGLFEIGSGIGHNLPQEAPVAFAKAVIDADAL